LAAASAFNACLIPSREVESQSGTSNLPAWLWVTVSAFCAACAFATSDGFAGSTNVRTRNST
jgi:hypothetical protein